jgi:hypothetical protein
MQQLRTILSESTIEYGEFKTSGWFLIGGIDHPLCKILIDGIVSLKHLIPNHQVFLVGGVLEDWIGSDVDVTITGDTVPPVEFFIQVHKLSFYLHLYVDLHYQRTVWDPSGMKYEEHWCYEYSNHFAKDGVKSDLSFYQKDESGLYKRYNVYPFPKHLAAATRGYTYHPPFRIV